MYQKIKLCVPIFFLVFLVSCSTTPPSNIDENKEKNPIIEKDEIEEEKTTSYFEIDKNGNKTTWYYDENNNVTSIVRDSENSIIEEYYNENDIIYRCYIRYYNGITTEITYHDNGMKHTSFTKNLDDTTVEEVCTYDGLSCKTTYSTGDAFHTTYYPNGKVKTDTVYANNGQIDYYTYDENGEVFSHRVVDKEGNEYIIK